MTTIVPTWTPQTPQTARRTGRRGNHEGSITQLGDGRWQARVTLDGGRRKAYYGKTRLEVQQKLSAALHDRDRGVPVVGEKQTLANYVPGWVQSLKHTMKPRSWQRCEELTRIHILPALGKLRLSRLQPQDLQQLYTAKLDAGLSPTTVRYIHMTVRGALAEAERTGLVPRNVARLVKPPRKQQEEMRVLDSDEVNRLLEAARGDRLECLYVVAVHTGARLGELLALRWKDVSLDRASVSIQATLQKTRDGFAFAPPKSARSRRHIDLTPTAVAALRQHRKRQVEERLAVGAAWDGQHDLVFCTQLGQPLSGIHILRYQFHPLLERAGLPCIRFHDLRHTHATLLLGRGVNPKIVSERLGHSTVAITLDLYSHVLPTMQQMATGALEAALGNA
jgi:integrase